MLPFEELVLGVIQELGLGLLERWEEDERTGKAVAVWHHGKEYLIDFLQKETHGWDDAGTNRQ